MTIDWLEPVEFEDGTAIDRVDLEAPHPSLVKVWPAALPDGFPTGSPYPDYLKVGVLVKLDGVPMLKDWDDAVPVVVQSADRRAQGWGIF